MFSHSTSSMVPSPSSSHRLDFTSTSSMYLATKEISSASSSDKLASLSADLAIESRRLASNASAPFTSSSTTKDSRSTKKSSSVHVPIPSSQSGPVQSSPSKAQTRSKKSNHPPSKRIDPESLAKHLDSDGLATDTRQLLSAPSGSSHRFGLRTSLSTTAVNLTSVSDSSTEPSDSSFLPQRTSPAKPVNSKSPTSRSISLPSSSSKKIHGSQSKPSLRSRLFGFKSSKSSSPASSNLVSPRDQLHLPRETRSALSATPITSKPVELQSTQSTLVAHDPNIGQVQAAVIQTDVSSAKRSPSRSRSKEAKSNETSTISYPHDSPGLESKPKDQALIELQRRNSEREISSGEAENSRSKDNSNETTKTKTSFYSKKNNALLINPVRSSIATEASGSGSPSPKTPHHDTSFLNLPRPLSTTQSDQDTFAVGLGPSRQTSSLHTTLTVTKRSTHTDPLNEPKTAILDSSVSSHNSQVTVRSKSTSNVMMTSTSMENIQRLGVGISSDSSRNKSSQTSDLVRSISDSRSLAKSHMGKHLSNNSLASNSLSSIPQPSHTPGFGPRSSSLYGNFGGAEAQFSRASRPSSGSSFASPPMQKRTTSASNSVTSSPRPGISHDSPTTSSTFVHHPRMSRPRTADSSHVYSNSFSSLREALIVASIITEESVKMPSPPSQDEESSQAYATKESPASLSHQRFESNSSAYGRRSASIPTEGTRPGLPPKNPLRNRRVSTATGSSMSRGDDQPTSTSPPASPRLKNNGLFRHPFRFPAPAQDDLDRRALAPATPSRPGDATSFGTPMSSGHGQMVVSPWIDSPREMQTDHIPSPSSTRIPPLLSNKDSNPGIGLSSSVLQGKSASPDGHALWASSEDALRSNRLLSTPSSTILTTGLFESRPMSSSITMDAISLVSSSKKSKLALASAWKSGKAKPKAVELEDGHENESSDKRKKEGNGSKIWAFARELGGLDADGEGGSIRKGKSFRAKKTDAASRLQIRRVFDAPEEPTEMNPQDEVNTSTDDVGQGSSSSSATAFAIGPDLSSQNSMPSLKSRRSFELPSTMKPRASELVRSPSMITGPRGNALVYHCISPSNSALASSTSLERSPGFGSQGWSVSQDNLDTETRRLVKRWFILRELVDTERAYASDLAVARDIYLARAKVKTGVLSPVSPISVSSSTFFSQLSSPGPSFNPKLQHPHLQRSPQPVGQAPIIKHSGPQSPAKHLFRHASADSNPHALQGGTVTLHPNSPGSLTSSNPSNRSSMYTVSSQSSQTSETASFPIPALPQGLPLSTATSIDASASTNANSGSNLINARSIINPSSTSIGGTSIPSTTSTPVTAKPTSLTPTMLTPNQYGLGPTSAAGMADSPFSAADVRIIFAHLEHCAALADEMVVILEDAVGSICLSSPEVASGILASGNVKEDSEPDKVGQAFLKLMPRIEQVYTAYCSRHESSMARLQELTSSQPKVAAFLKQCTDAARKHTNAWDLASLLIKPVQRVLKYPLLLQQILSNTTEKHPDLENLRAASDEIEKVADNINEVKKRKDLVEQIVGNKTTKRSASQKVSHGTTKKLLKRHEKVPLAVLGPPPDIASDNVAYKALVTQLVHLENGVGVFTKQCIEWSEALHSAYLAQVKMMEQWRATYLLSDENDSADVSRNLERIHTFVVVLQESIIDIHWRQLDSEIRSSLIPVIQRICQMFANPQSVIVKRNDLELDYVRYRQEMIKPGTKASDRKLIENAAAFAALHSQLMDELPQFNYGVQTLLDLCVESFARLQAAHHLRVKGTLVDFWDKYSYNSNKDEIVVDPKTGERSMRHLNPVKLFWEVHSSVSNFAEGLQIASPRTSRDRSASSHFERPFGLPVPSGTVNTVAGLSPLNLSKELPNPEVAPSLALGLSHGIPVTRTVSITTEASGSVTSFKTAVGASGSGFFSASAFATPTLGSASPKLGPEQLLGSPAHITSSVLPSSKSSGLVALVSPRNDTRSLPHSISNSPRMSGNKSFEFASQRDFAGTESSSSIPPTPISKDECIENMVPKDPPSTVTKTAGQSGVRNSVPVLPALCFHGEAPLFRRDSNGLHFLEKDLNEVLEQASVDTSLQPSESWSQSGNTSFRSANADESFGNESDSKGGSDLNIRATMAAVAANLDRTKQLQRKGYPILTYDTGDLFHVMLEDNEESGWLFGKSEYGDLGWVQRNAFILLS